MVVHGGIAAGAGLEQIKEIDNDLGEGNLKIQLDAIGRGIFLIHKNTTLAFDQFHYRTIIFGGRKDNELHPGLKDLLNGTLLGEVGG